MVSYKIIMERFPNDFSDIALQNKLDGTLDKCLCKYRERIYIWE